MGSIDRVFAFGRIVASALVGDSRAVLVNLRMLEPDLGAPDTEAETSTEARILGPLGHFGRPDPPDDVGFCETIGAKTDDGAEVFAVRDLRLSKRVNPKDGELGLSHYGGGFLSMAWNESHDGTTITLNAPTLTSDGAEIDKAHALVLDSKSSEPTVALIHQMGQSVIMNDAGSVVITSSDGVYLEVSNKGLVFAGEQKLVGGIIAGDTTTAQKVLLVEAWDAWAQAATTMLTTLAGAVNTLAPGSVTLPAIAELEALAALLSTVGASKTLQASPV